jgi:hypothetical protein
MDSGIEAVPAHSLKFFTIPLNVRHPRDYPSIWGFAGGPVRR